MAKDKIKVNYAKMDTEKLAELLGSLSKENQEKYNAKQFVETKPEKTELVAVLNADGTPKIYIGKNGKTKIKMKRVAVGDKKKKDFNLMKAKRAFFDMFEEEFEWEAKPKKKANKEAEESKVSEALASMGIVL